jgi:hypothetical protein
MMAPTCEAASLEIPPLRASHVFLEHIHGRFSGRLSASQHLYVCCAGGAESIDPDGIFLRMDFFLQSRFHEQALFAREKTFKDAVLYPDTKSGEGTVHAGSSPIVWDIITHNIESTFVG